MANQSMIQREHKRERLIIKYRNKRELLKDSLKNAPSFQERLGAGLQDVAKAQNSAAELAKNFELGTENDLAKVMVSQQVSSLAFQLTLNVRNKALSAYKDIMNMPV